MQSGRRAFTLVELLVVIAIISVLAAMLLPTLTEGMEQARRVSCLGNQKQLYIAAANYAQDANDWLPCDNRKCAGDGVCFSNIRSLGGDISMRYFVSQYASVRLVNFLEVPVSDLHAADVRFSKKAGQRGIMACSGSRITESANWMVSLSSDYRIWGFGTCYGEITANISHTRLGKLGIPGAGGAPKCFSSDNLWNTRIGDHRAFMYDLAASHRPGDPQGMNVVAGDGSGRWNAGPWASWCSSRAVPRGYYALGTYFTWGTYTGIYYYDPDGTQRYYRKETPGNPTYPFFDAAKHDAAMRMWF